MYIYVDECLCLSLGAHCHAQGAHVRVFLDCTVGAGGHAAAMLQQHPEIQLLIGLDGKEQAEKFASLVYIYICTYVSCSGIGMGSSGPVDDDALQTAAERLRLQPHRNALVVLLKRNFCDLTRYCMSTYFTRERKMCMCIGSKVRIRLWLSPLHLPPKISHPTAGIAWLSSATVQMPF